jgi:hypothetical protein
MKNTVKVDKIGFNKTHWSTKTEKEFIDEGIKARTHPVGLADAGKTAWLKKAYAAIKGDTADKEPSKEQVSK